MTRGLEGVRLREAEPADWEAIAALQVASWRFAYRGILTDAYLDDELEAERTALWRRRFAGSVDPNQITVLAEGADSRPGAEPLAFCCILAGSDPRWGSLVDNLHVHPDALRLRLGRRVFREAARLLVGGAHEATPLHLTVLEENERAKAAYERWQGRLVEHPTKRQPDGRVYQLRRYAWDGPAALIARLDGLG
ncbi:GNAT family N-acetyltransferase [Enterovirga rhinocerotis]|uniref:Ribosomal protein S18 acetylase RimI-like enzyme n=1 Tax=Enterovirga rhinocerotis TaxID=1339210 RepID=A0A4R7BPJ0_9HYPH|nr:GNAT family N-acetyltransferase [Enterovirga rhinocerotis]TDR87063.1 ribosomal protein S18 acetylase RimI-like enzyme [Enterovirga rhinocerotis]